MHKIYTFTKAFYPGEKSGGPVLSIFNIIENILSQENFFIITADRDVGDITPYRNISVNRWLNFNGSQIIYVSYGIFGYLKIFNIVKNLEDNSILYINSFFCPKFSIFPLLVTIILRKKIKILIAPRGEFSPGALKIKSYKKLLYIYFYKKFFINSSKIFWHASTQLEAHEINYSFIFKDPNLHIKTAGNIIIASDIYSSNYVNTNEKKLRISNNKFNIVFISRISRKKNLLFALNILKNSNININFDIYGPIEDKTYWMECEKLISTLPKNIFVTYKGVLSSSDVKNTFALYDLFFFPTLGENFGHVIIEALCSNIPILLSDQTPWSHFEEFNVGYIFSLNEPSKFLHALTEINNKYFPSENFKIYLSKFSNNRDSIFQNEIMFNSLM